MYASLKRLRDLEKHTKVCCAHEYTEDNLLFACSIEPQNLMIRKRYEECVRIRRKGGTVVPSTMELECETNPFLRWDNDQLFLAIQKEHPKLKNNQEAEIFAATRKLKDSKKYRS